MDGIVLVDKPPGITSGECVRRVKKILNAGKAGHSGSLDGNASGILLIALGDSVKSLSLLMGLDKGYEGIIHFHGDLDVEGLKTVVKNFTGRVRQTPPRRSAVARRPRVREIYSLDILSIRGGDVYFRARVQAGTYMRRLAADMGDALGMKAHLRSLRRTGLGPFSLKDCRGLGDLGRGDVLPLERVLSRTGKG